MTPRCRSDRVRSSAVVGAIPTAAARSRLVAAATAPAVPGLLGPGGPDAWDHWHPGLPWAGCSILAASSAQMAAIRQQALGRQWLTADMPAAAQATRVYDDYLRELAKTHPDGLALLAVSLIGPRNQVAKLVRHLELLA